jgi:hypothetical protein
MNQDIIIPTFKAVRDVWIILLAALLIARFGHFPGKPGSQFYVYAFNRWRFSFLPQENSVGSSIQLNYPPVTLAAFADEDFLQPIQLIVFQTLDELLTIFKITQVSEQLSGHYFFICIGRIEQLQQLMDIFFPPEFILCIFKDILPIPDPVVISPPDLLAEGFSSTFYSVLVKRIGSENERLFWIWILGMENGASNLA